ncbi:PA-phosphatase [Marinitenerispora sediminis]|uniref:PA-phosphatase n=2 Tax=Marinitenerispora sediminis TaxID=1931232 RepID=A0A368TAI7_9ACTN|nr:PA-phosphatase [Marinitenerispora sediminis]RCV60045.1 PA-phosphatase [Marinitenerispora sediminis]RCV61952.1 PA-phosphatase [Marinitenerispora sediminis]
MGAAALPFVVLCALVSAQWPPLMAFDAAVADTLYERVHPDPALAHGLEIWTEVFGTWSMRIVSLLTAGWLLLRRQFSTAVWAGAAVFLANLFGLIVKLTVDRARPEFADPITEGVGPSFPSGHALMAATGMGILLFAALPLLRGAWRHVGWTLAVGAAMSTALSRPMLGVHYVTDIVAGLSLGVFALAATMLLWTYLPPIARRWDRPARRR